MEYEELLKFINKTVFIELKDTDSIKGILVQLKKDEDEDGIEEIKLIIRVNSDNYRVIYVNEIEDICEFE